MDDRTDRVRKCMLIHTFSNPYPSDHPRPYPGTPRELYPSPPPTPTYNQPLKTHSPSTMRWVEDIPRHYFRAQSIM